MSRAYYWQKDYSDAGYSVIAGQSNVPVNQDVLGKTTDDTVAWFAQDTELRWKMRFLLVIFLHPEALVYMKPFSELHVCWSQVPVTCGSAQQSIRKWHEPDLLQMGHDQLAEAATGGLPLLPVPCE